ncbi:MAG: hydantoinase/oxoprolinase family protein [Phycisphaerae bacterium]
MSLKIGIDVGGTFTDFLVARQDAEPQIHKVLSTPSDPSIALVNGLSDVAAKMALSETAFAGAIDTIVHGTTVTTNAVLTGTGARTGLLTTRGLRDALEMRRGVREEQYNNRYTNVRPLVPRYLRTPVRERLNYRGDVLEPVNLDDVHAAIALYKAEHVDAVAICFMNAFANAEHERRAAELVRSQLPDAYLTVSSELLPSIRFYDRVSSTVLNSYVGPKLDRYLDRLVARLKEFGFAGVLLVMQSNGGVMAPAVARQCPARTLLSGPAAGPEAGLGYVRSHGYDSCITVDMGGTSFDAALVQDGMAGVVTEGAVNRHRIALPMLDIATIGAGGGSIATIDEGGLLRMGPHSAGADPGPVCYGKGGTRPTCTDADLVLGYLDPTFFAGGKIQLDAAAAGRAIETHIAGPLGLSVEAAAAGMVRVINTNMAEGVRAISVKRGFDPRDVPLVAAGGAGPLHAAMICRELEIPVFIVPRASSILCAAGMLHSDLRYDFVSSFVSMLDAVDFKELQARTNEMMDEGARLLASGNIPDERRQYAVSLDCRYVKQYHEVSFGVVLDALRRADLATISEAFHTKHKALYGYSLEAEGIPVELINVRVRATGKTEKPTYVEECYAGPTSTGAVKGERRILVPEHGTSDMVSVYDGHKTRYGNCIAGPAIVEQVNTTLLVTASYDCICDHRGSFVVYAKGQEERLPQPLQEKLP